MPDLPTGAIVIVSYNVGALLDDCLASLRRDPALERWPIVVVDNGSTDGTLTRLAERWPTVRVESPGSNLGFARANNLGIRSTRGELLLLLNPDTVVPHGAVPALVAALGRHPRAAAIGPRLVDADGRPELSFGWATSPFGEFRQKVMRRAYARRLPWLSGWVARQIETAAAQEWVSGACLLVRRAPLEAVGLFDERFFMYYEDVDLCASLRAAGWDVRYEPSVEVVHLRGRSGASNPRLDGLRRASQLAYYEKRHPFWVPALRAHHARLRAGAGGSGSV